MTDENENDGQELYKKHRPTKLSELVGQDDAVRMLRQMGKDNKIPHCVLFTGPSGCGKTTIARILKRLLDCSDTDFSELNIADVRGIDTIRDIRNRMHLSPMGGKTRIWLLDECARATVDAQNALLKMLEDTPSHVYFFLATTEPQKMLNTIRTRATVITMHALKDTEMKYLLIDVAEKESFKLSEEVLDRIIEVAEGSPRKALVLLNQVVGLVGEEEQLAVVMSGVASAESIELCRILLSGKAQWSSVAKILKALQDDAEGVRRHILAYATSVLLNSGSSRAYDVVCSFERDYFASGKAGLVASCFEVVGMGTKKSR